MATETIKTERLTLRKFRIDDAEAMYENWASDSEVTKFLTWSPHESIEVTKYVLELWVKEYETDFCYKWAIIYNDGSDRPIGSIGVVAQEDTVGMVAIGYCIGKKYWHKGITSEALQAVIDFLFKQEGINRIEARHDVNNPNSGRVMQKCGMTYEGTLRQIGRNNTGLCDCCYYAILKEDYIKGKQ